MTPAKWLFGFGLIALLFSAFLFWERYNPERLSFAVNDYLSQTTGAKATSAPTEIIIPAIKLDLPIIPAKMEKNKWEATTKGISYLSSSPVPGESGNSILYGHNWPNLLGNIVKLKPGQSIQIKYADGRVKDFIIASTVSVSPNDTGILAPSEKPQITLYTCSGFWDRKRFVIVAKLLS